MKRLIGLSCILAAGMFMGCASSSNTENAQTAADAAQAPAAESAAEVAAAKAPNAPKSNMIAQECKGKILKMVTKQEGGQQYLLDDGTLWQVMPDRSIKLVKKLPDAAENYALIPSTDVIIHFKTDKVMLVHVETDTEFFNLKGDPSLKTVIFTPDNKEMGILDKDSTVHIWNVPNKFTGINIAETVQDFINRQSPDHNLHFLSGAYNIMLAGNDKAVIANDDIANNKIGLIQSMDEEAHKGVIKTLARTNAHIAHLAVSPSTALAAATDVNHQLYVTANDPDKKGFKAYATKYTDAQNVKFVGENVLVITSKDIILLDSATGLPIWTRDVKANTCFAPTPKTLFCNTGDTIEEINGADGKLVRTLFFNDKTWGEVKGDDNSLGGTADASCLK